MSIVRLFLFCYAINTYTLVTNIFRHAFFLRFIVMTISIIIPANRCWREHRSEWRGKINGKNRMFKKKKIWIPYNDMHVTWITVAAYTSRQPIDCRILQIWLLFTWTLAVVFHWTDNIEHWTETLKHWTLKHWTEKFLASFSLVFRWQSE